MKTTKLLSIILICAALTACGKKASIEEDLMTPQTVQPNTSTETDIPESKPESPITPSTAPTDISVGNHNDFLPDGWFVVPEMHALRSINIGAEETVAWNVLPYELVVYIHEQLLSTGDSTIPIYLPTDDEETGRIDITLEMAGTFLEALKDKPGYYIRVGKYLPQGTMAEEYNTSNTDEVCVLLYMEAFEIERYAQLLDMVATESGKSKKYELTIKPVQLCPSNSHDGFLCHTATVTLTTDDIESAQEILKTDPDGLIVLQYTAIKKVEYL